MSRVKQSFLRFAKTTVSLSSAVRWGTRLARYSVAQVFSHGLS